MVVELSKEIAESVLYSKTAREIWEELEERFGQSNGPQRYHLQKQIRELAQGNMDIAGYYTKLKRLWDELDSLDVFQTGIGDCTCQGKAKTIKSEQDARLIQFLMGLNDAYAGPRSNLLMLCPLPSVNYAYSLFIRDEKQREVQIDGHPGATAFQISTHPGTSAFYAGKQPYTAARYSSEKKPIIEGKKNTSGLFCTYCKKQNHTINNCYRLIGFPADFKFIRSKKVGPGPKSNAVFSTEEPENHAGGQPITQDQFHSPYQLLQHVKIVSEADKPSEEVATANCAGTLDYDLHSK